MRIKTKKYIYTLFILFFALFLTYLWLLKNYIYNSEKSYTNAVKNEIVNLIEQKKLDTYAIAKDLANNSKLITTLKEKKYSQFYTSNFINIPKEYLNFHHTRIHIVDKDGYQRYLSWTKEDLGNYILNDRDDLRALYKHPKPMHGISVGKFSIAFKGIVPIYDQKHHFLGIIETITYFNSIAHNLEENDVYSAIVIDNKFYKRLKYPISDLFIAKYNIANLNIRPEIIKILKKYTIPYFIHNKTFLYSTKDSSIFQAGYYIATVPIKNYTHKTVAYYIAFIHDKYYLTQKKTLLAALLFILSLLFLAIVYLALKEYKRNIILIKNLDKEVKKQLHEKTKLLYIDPVTGAYKKTKFDIDRLDNLDTKTVLLNIKNFSKLNAFYGFDVGDKILRKCTQRIENFLQRKIYRLNGDEFLFFSTNPKQDIKGLKDYSSHTPIKIISKNLSIQIACTFGVAPTKLDKLISKLSIAVHEAKEHPFSYFMYYREKSLDSNFIKFNALLYKAIYREDGTKIIPYFQGIYDNKKKKIYKYEALARLQNHDKIYSPYYFINIAQSSGFIHEITKIMIEKSFAYLATLPQDIEFSINITEHDLATKQLKEFLLDNLKKYQLTPERITLEILEGITSNGTKNNIKQLNQLKALGFKLAIDDFGVEYSNFERLTEIDIDFIKIDGKYIKTLLTNEKSLQITKAICNFAHTMNIKVVAEFVENREIQEIIENLGIDYSQGYTFSEPSATIKQNEA
jgi:EAL domain-containing protein (putative c-di-GMP-specific phosphodiesterase class I)/GGDEF domain-containing protein